jgi:hypothetical protein
MIIILVAIFYLVNSITPVSNAIGTTLPRLSTTGYTRVFNDLMKQSSIFIPFLYQWGNYGQQYYTPNLSTTLYPFNVSFPVALAATISFIPSIDDGLIQNNYTITFDGNGLIGVSQKGNNSFNNTISAGNSLTFKLGNLNNPLYVWIYSSDINNPVQSIKILPNDQSTFSSNFLNYIKPFNILRFCYWQGQNLYNSGISVQYWTKVITKKSATQISPLGIAYEHMLEL